MKANEGLTTGSRSKLYLSAAALVLALVAAILYFTKGIIPGYSTSYSVGVLTALVVGMAGNVIFAFKRVDTLEAIPFVAYIIAIIIFVASNAEYLTAVIRAIDVTRVETSFILTIVFLFAAAVVYAVSFVTMGKKDKM